LGLDSAAFNILIYLRLSYSSEFQLLFIGSSLCMTSYLIGIYPQLPVFLRTIHFVEGLFRVMQSGEGIEALLS